MPFRLYNAPANFQRLMQNCLSELNLTYCLIYLDDVIVYSKSPEEHLQRMRVVFECLREHGLKLKPSKCELFKTEIIYLTHHVSKVGVKPLMKNVTAIVECPPPKTFTDVRSFTGLVGHYRQFIKGFTNIAAPLHDLTSEVNKDKKAEPVVLSAEALEAFETLKKMCVQAPILSFPDFKKPFLLETDASGKGMGAVLSQKQDDGQSHPIAFASRDLMDTVQRYHSNKKEFLALKWAVTEQFREYLYPYGKFHNEFVVHMDNNPLTYVLSSACLNATGHRWVACLANYNISLEYQKGKDNTVADYLSRVESRLPSEEVKEYENKIPILGVKALLNNAGTSIEERAKAGDDLPTARAQVEEVLSAFPAQFVTVHTTDWKQAQKDDPVLYAIVKNMRASRKDFKKVLKYLIDKKFIQAYVKMRAGLVLKDGLLYQKTRLKSTGEEIFCFIVPTSHQGVALDGCHQEAAHQGQRRSLSLMQEHFWWPGMAREIV